MDEFDRASDLEQKQREISLKHREPELIPAGFCYWCDSEIRPGHLFCDADCRDDYQKDALRKRREGDG